MRQSFSPDHKFSSNGDPWDDSYDDSYDDFYDDPAGDPYGCFTDDDTIERKACSATDCTGLIPALPDSEEELEAYADLYHYPGSILED